MLLSHQKTQARNISIGDLVTTRIVFLTLLLIVPILQGCGGGTSGTGGGQFAINGSVKTAALAPVPGVEVVVTSTAPAMSLGGETIPVSKSINTDITDDQGQFMLELDTAPSSFVIRFRKNASESEISIATVPQAAATVILDTVFDTDTHSVSGHSELYEDENGVEVQKEEETEHGAALADSELHEDAPQVDEADVGSHDKPESSDSITPQDNK